MKRSSTKRRKVPFIRQVEMADCGAACLAMILAAHGKETSLEDIKQRMPVDAQGIDAFSLLQTAEFYGLEGRGVETNTAALRRLPLPVILHWAKKHFVVLVGWSRGKTQIFDPGAGRLKLAINEFEEHFSGTALLFAEEKLTVRRQSSGATTKKHLPQSTAKARRKASKPRMARINAKTTRIKKTKKPAPDDSDER